MRAGRGALPWKTVSSTCPRGATSIGFAGSGISRSPAAAESGAARKTATAPAAVARAVEQKRATTQSTYVGLARLWTDLDRRSGTSPRLSGRYHPYGLRHFRLSGARQGAAADARGDRVAGEEG